MSRMHSGYIVVIVWEDQTKTYQGPFFTQERAEQYVKDCPEIVDYHIAPLVIPHSHVVDVIVRY